MKQQHRARLIGMGLIAVLLLAAAWNGSSYAARRARLAAELRETGRCAAWNNAISQWQKARAPDTKVALTDDRAAALIRAAAAAAGVGGEQQRLDPPAASVATAADESPRPRDSQFTLSGITMQQLIQFLYQLHDRDGIRVQTLHLTHWQAGHWGSAILQLRWWSQT